MDLSDYETLDGVAMAQAVRKGEVSPTELLAAAIARVEARNPRLNAVVDEMYAEAENSIDAGLVDGPLRGVPFLLKDLHVGYAGTTTSNGSRFFADHVIDHDTELVARYKRAGLVIFGKTHSPEFGLTTTTETALHGQTRNPWNDAHTSGGSSGGASSAVAARMIPVAHASDGGGSIRIPASCCGLFGLKPTRARIPSGPDAGEGWSGMSAQHVVSRSVRDSAVLLDATAGPDLGDPYWAPPPERSYAAEVETHPGRLRIAVQTTTFNGVPTHPDCTRAAEDAAALLGELGHEIVEAKLEVDSGVLAEATRVVIAANLRATLEDRAAVLGRAFTEADIEPVTWAMAEAAALAGSAEYARAIRSIHSLGRRVATAFEDFDVLLTPTMAAPPSKLGQASLSNPDTGELLATLSASVGFTQLFNATGQPSASVPLAWNDAGLPIGLEITGRFGDEASLFRLAGQLEQARPWFDRTPPGLEPVP